MYVYKYSSILTVTYVCRYTWYSTYKHKICRLNQSNQYVLQHLRTVPLRKIKHKPMSFFLYLSLRRCWRRCLGFNSLFIQHLISYVSLFLVTALCSYWHYVSWIFFLTNLFLELQCFGEEIKRNMFVYAGEISIKLLL